MPRDLPWFGCTATLDIRNQDYILEHAGFDLRPGELKIIRTSIDRPEISIIVQPWLRGGKNDYRRLDFLVDGARPGDLQTIKKVIVYIDSKPRLIAARYSMISFLVKSRGFNKTLARKVVRRYDADVRDIDKDLIYKDFQDDTGCCKVLFASISMGMGMNTAGVRRVVQWGPPPGNSIADVWQRVGRAMRGDMEGQGEAYIFAPYYWFDHLGTDERPVRAKKKPKKKTPYQPAVPSRLRQISWVDRDDEDSASQASSINSQQSVEYRDNAVSLEEENQNLFDFSKKIAWSKTDKAQREKRDLDMAEFLNASCFRQMALKDLQEPDDPDLEYKRPVGEGLCCNACNHSLG